ncbi:hypothetical protein GRI38_13830 [Altererythrobacter aurantiacus]|uniref:Uncharacterized protein n=1 Tax=Parapontixanthobacter aurantiacus TaxID=1463599 RepID=A0A844ZH49_9SPHN|nr:hypothetical protein [Parapontixanthobacter aurantiacus]MXO87108.1 hypothetical protein [Parapontixanthobacter aurantiacus]
MNQIIPYDWENLPTTRSLQREIENLPITAEAKLSLERLSKVTVRAGEQIVEVGRRILAFAFELIRQFPNLTLAIAAALTINALLISVPLLGPLLQPLYGPVILAAGVGAGALAELIEGDMRVRMDAVITEFEAIFA